jgi:hypothetical protein
VGENTFLINKISDNEFIGYFWDGHLIKELHFRAVEYDLVKRERVLQNLAGVWEVFPTVDLKPYLKAPDVIHIINENNGFFIGFNNEGVAYPMDLSKNAQVIFVFEHEYFNWMEKIHSSSTKMEMVFRGEKVLYVRKD